MKVNEIILKLEEVQNNVTDEYDRIIKEGNKIKDLKIHPHDVFLHDLSYIEFMIGFCIDDLEKINKEMEKISIAQEKEKEND